MASPNKNPPPFFAKVLLERDREEYNRINILNLLGAPRKPTTFYMKKSVATAFRSYAKRHPSYNVADCVEYALLEYMQNHPLHDVSLNFKVVEKIKDRVLQNRIEETILSSEITRVVDLIDRRSGRGQNNNGQYVCELQDLLLKAIRLKDPSDATVKILERAEGYL